MLCGSLSSQSQTLPTDRFSSDNGDGTYTNPILRGDYPDTDIIRVGEDYYMISSSFACMPGIPVCHSKDLVNWKIIGHAYPELTSLPAYSMEKENTAYGRACWAPTIRYHDGWFYIGVNLKADHFVMCKSRKPEGPYEVYHYKQQLYDPGMFIDDDGSKYMLCGMNEIVIVPLNDEGTEVRTPGDRGKVIIHAPEGQRLYFEGTHAYKRNGWYYIFNTAQGYSGLQMVSRSRNLYGPYETRLILDDDLNYAGAGLHQGGYVDTADGESWAFTFQDRDYMGRDVCLYPMRWVEDWPVIGLDPDPTKLTPELMQRVGRITPGKGVVTYRKPYVSKLKTSDGSSIVSPWENDDFSAKTLKPVWEFSHVPIPEKWSLSERKGFFRLYASPAKGFEWARNSITQKIVAPASRGTVKVDISGLKENDFAGCGIMGSLMIQQGVMRTASGLQLQIHTSKHVDDKLEKTKELPSDTKVIWLRTSVTKRGTVKLSYSLDGKSFETWGPELSSGFWRFLGLRYALCCYNEQHRDSAFFTTEKLKAAKSGYADFDEFTIESNLRGNHYDAFSQTDFDLYDDKELMSPVRPMDYVPDQYLRVDSPKAWLSFFNMHFDHETTGVEIELKARMSNVVIVLHEGDAYGEVLGRCKVKATGGKWARQNYKVKIPKGQRKLTITFEGDTDGMLMKNIKFI